MSGSERILGQGKGVVQTGKAVETTEARGRWSDGRAAQLKGGAH